MQTWPSGPGQDGRLCQMREIAALLTISFIYIVCLELLPSNSAGLGLWTDRQRRTSVIGRQCSWWWWLWWWWLVGGCVPCQKLCRIRFINLDIGTYIRVLHRLWGTTTIIVSSIINCNSISLFLGLWVLGRRSPVTRRYSKCQRHKDIHFHYAVLWALLLPPHPYSYTFNFEVYYCRGVGALSLVILSSRHRMAHFTKQQQQHHHGKGNFNCYK